MFRRKASEPSTPPSEEVAASAAGPRVGPFDSTDVPVDDIERIDLGGLHVRLGDGFELRLQVDEATQSVQAVMLAGRDGGVELRPFAAARNDDFWTTARAELAADLEQRGAHPVERAGTFGPEIYCELPIALPHGKSGAQPTRFAGINGPRWLLRATFVGVPATDPEQAGPWEDLVRSVVVHRGTGAMPPGDPLPLTLPPGARREE